MAEPSTSLMSRPATTPARYSVYWVSSGWSRPMLWRTAAIWPLSQRGPQAARAGSAGAA